MRQEVDWAAVRKAEAAMEEAGIKPILLLTHDDVEAAVGHELTEDVVEEALYLFKKNWDSHWADIIVDFITTD